MRPLARRLPPLSTLIAFEATVRLGSATAAARELGATQPAISQKLRALEDHLQVPLLARDGRRLRPTEAGLEYYETLAQALGRIAAKGEGLSRPTALTLSGDSGIVRFWLLPRVDALMRAFPGVPFSFVAAAEGEEPAAPLGFRLAFRLFEGGVRVLFAEQVMPVAAPELAARLPPQAWRQAPPVPLMAMTPRIGTVWLTWPEWYAATAVPWPQTAHQVWFSDYALMMEAVLAGRGIGLGWLGLVDDLVATGRLVAIGPTVSRSDRGYVLEARGDAGHRAADIARWILDQTRSG